MKTKVIICGEVRIGERGAIHQTDFAAALGAERLTAPPKGWEDVQIVVGRLLGNRKPAMLVKAQKANVPVWSVGDVMNEGVRNKLVALLNGKTKLESYERAALETLMADLPSQAFQALAEATPQLRKG